MSRALGTICPCTGEDTSVCGSIRQLLSGDNDLTRRGRSLLICLRLAEVHSDDDEGFIPRLAPLFGFGGWPRLPAFELEEAEPERR